MNHLNLKYYFNRNESLSLQNNRRKCAEREIQTFLSLSNQQSNFKFLENKSILDLGCGDSHLKDVVEQYGASYLGLDICDIDLETQKLSLGDNQFDFVFSLAVIEHLRDPSNLLSECYRTLRPGGSIWISTPDIKACRETFWDDPTHVRPYTKKSLNKILVLHGFESIKITPNYRCKPSHLYRGTPFQFFRARYMLPFRSSVKYAPEFLKGSCSGIFANGIKPMS